LRLLMTGGYGCIGSWVAKLVLEAGGELTILDLKEDRHRLDLLLLPELADRISFLGGDVSSLADVRSALDRSGADRVLHLAGLQTPSCRADPLRGALVNVIGTLAVFEAAAERPDQVQRVVYASSAAVHGPPEAGQTGPIPDQARLAPLSHYGAYKVCNELNARVYWLDRGLSSVGLRPWTVYGVGRDFGMTSEPTTAILHAALGRPYHISYGGRQDLQYARDVAATFLLALERPFEGADAFNMKGTVEGIEGFVEALERAVPEARGLVTHGDRQLPIAPDLDDSRLQAAFGPLPRTPLEQGIRETYDRFVGLKEQGRLPLSAVS
jgi:nucleoside-diphosphate-sugar epimerase